MASNNDGSEPRPGLAGQEESGPVVEKSTIDPPPTDTATAPPPPPDASTNVPASTTTTTESTANPNTNTQPATSSQPAAAAATEQSQPEPQETQPAKSSAETPEPSGSKIEEASSERPASTTQEPGDAGVSLVITLLLTTGARHPFKIDGRYLRKRDVNVPDYDPFAMSVYTLKELILREWRSEWEPRPSSPSAIRLISFGKLLEDKAPLSESKFNLDAPNVVHMTIKPQELLEEEDAKVAKNSQSRDRETNEGSTSCRCVIL